MAEIIGEIVGRAIVYGVAAVVISAAAEDEREKQLAIQQGNELLAAVSPMGSGWSIGIDVTYFRTHTVCQRCDSLFDTTDPDDKCRGNYYHTFTPKLHRIICLAAEKRFGKKPPKLFIPNIIKTPYEKYVVPPEQLEKDWLLLDEDENEFEKSSEKSSHPMANDYELLDEEDPQSSDLKELVICPEGAVPVSDEETQKMFEKQRRRAKLSISKEMNSKKKETVSSSSSSTTTASTSTGVSSFIRKLNPFSTSKRSNASTSTSISTTTSTSSVSNKKNDNEDVVAPQPPIVNQELPPSYNDIQTNKQSEQPISPKEQSNNNNSEVKKNELLNNGPKPPSEDPALSALPSAPALEPEIEPEMELPSYNAALAL